MTLWINLLLAVTAGVLLNLTPCVLPALPIKLRAITRVVGDGARQRALAGVALLGGTLTFFGGLAVATAALHWTWGTLFQAVWFRAALAVLLVGLGVYSLTGRGVQPPQWVYRIQGSGYAEPYLAGLLAAVLSAPCTGPFLGGVLAFALTQAPSTIFALFAAVGLGLTLPYLILLVRPELLRRLPRSGPGLRRVQQTMGLVLLAGAAFFAGTVLPARFGLVLWSVWLGVLTFWLARALWIGPGLGARLVPALVLAAVAGGAFTTGPDHGGGPAGNRLPWQPLDARALAAARAAGRPVLIEFTADWCINCKVLEHTAYANRAVLRAAASTDMRTLRADLTRPNPRAERYLRSFGGAGVPFAVVLKTERHCQPALARSLLGRHLASGNRDRRSTTMIPFRQIVTRWLAPGLIALSVAGMFLYWQWPVPPDAPGTPASQITRSAAAVRTSADVVALRVNRQGRAIQAELNVRDHWHINANPASLDFLIPTQVDVTGNGGVLPIRLDYPAGHAIEVGLGQPIRVYSRHTRLVAELPTEASAAPRQVNARVQACNDTGRCLAPSTLSAAITSSEQQ